MKPSSSTLSEAMGRAHSPECQSAYGIFKEAKRILISVQKRCRFCALHRARGDNK